MKLIIHLPKLLKTILFSFILLSLLVSCQKDDSFDDYNEEYDYSIDLNLANETDWVLANEILVLINNHRASLGLTEIEIDYDYASAYAVEHTNYMIENNLVNHDNFGYRSGALKDRGAISVGENVAYGYTNAEDVVYAWLHSPTHKNIIEGDYSHLGFGVIQNENGTYFFTQLFTKNLKE